MAAPQTDTVQRRLACCQIVRAIWRRGSRKRRAANRSAENPGSCRQRRAAEDLFVRFQTRKVSRATGIIPFRGAF